MKTSLEDLQNKLQHWRTSCKHPGRFKLDNGCRSLEFVIEMAGIYS